MSDTELNTPVKEHSEAVYRLGEGAYGIVETTPTGTAIKYQKITPESFREYVVGRHTLDHTHLISMYDLKMIDCIENSSIIDKSITNGVSIEMEKGLYNLSNMYRTGKTVHDITTIMYKILLGVHHIHTRGLIHRDLKPENIVMFENNHPKIIDFGKMCVSYKEMVSGCHHTGEVQTIWWRSPEVTLGRPYGTPVDIWSCGGILMDLIDDNFTDMANAFLLQCRDTVKHKNLRKYQREIVSDNMFVFRFYSYILGGQSFKNEDIFKNLVSDDYNFNSIWINKKHPRLSEMVGKLSKNHPLLDLVVKMLAWDPKKRITASEALRHPCFSSMCMVKLTRMLPCVKEYDWSSKVVSKSININLNTRNILYGELYETFEYFKISPEILVCTYRVIDEWLYKHPSLPSSELRLVGSAVAYLITSMYLINPPEYPRDWTTWNKKIDTFTINSLAVDITKSIDIYGITREFFKHNISKHLWEMMVYIIGTINIGSKPFNISHVFSGSGKKIKDWDGVYISPTPSLKIFENNVRKNIYSM
jgi:serine/threonine protein kinase